MPRREKGVRRHGAGYEIFIRVRGTLLTDTLPITSTAQQRRDRRQQLKDAHLARHPAAAARGTFAADVERYLRTLADRTRLQAERRTQLAWWGAKFGQRARHTIDRPEILTALAALAAAPVVKSRRPDAPAHRRSVSSLRHYRTALYHLYSTLDGTHAPNPLRDIPPPRGDDPEPRAIPYPIIDAIFQAMPERGQGLRHQPRGAVSKTKARLRVMAFTGITPAQMARLAAADVHWDDPSVLVRGRKKGEGGRTRRLPLVPEGVAALRAFFAARAEGRFSTSAARHSFLRAIDTMIGTLAAGDWRLARAMHVQLTPRPRPYDLRHSFLTEAQLASGDIRATQELATHSDIRQTQRYTLAAVDPRLKVLAAQLAARLAGRGDVAAN